MKTILIIDDDARIRDIYSRLLKSEGFTVLETENAMDANKVMLKNAVDLVVLDINMPKVGGEEFYEVIQMFYGKAKVLVSSVYPIDEQKHLVEGADDYYDKANGPNGLVSKIRELLSK